MNTEKDYHAWRLDWTPAHVERFWDWWGGNPALSKHYFSKRYGEAVLDHTGRYVRNSKLVVDLGAGPGYIVDLLVRRGIKTIAVDTSEESLAVLEKRMKGHTSFLGTRVSRMNSIPLEDSAADVVFLIETVEHLDDSILQQTLRETYRLMKPGARLVITTPNDETLAELETICPNCGCVYHFYQHMRSWSAATLGDYLTNAGFETIRCAPTLFSALPRHLRMFHRLAYAVLGAKLPHLLYIGRKPKRI